MRDSTGGLLGGVKILLAGGKIAKTSSSTFLVTSEDNLRHRVRWIGRRWHCDCRRRPVCEHVNAVALLLQLPHIITVNLNPEQFTCPSCGAASDRLDKSGIQRNKSGMVQRYRCRTCGYRFNDRQGFEKLRSNPTLILISVDLFFEGLSTRQIRNHLASFYACCVSHVTVYRWVARYSKVLSEVDREIVKRLTLGPHWHSDETMAKVQSRAAYVWSILDHRSRYLLASYVANGRDAKTFEKILMEVVRNIGRLPKKMTTDGLYTYQTVFRRFPSVKHVHGRTLAEKANNNRIERLNKTLKKRLHNMEKFDGMNGARLVTEGFRSYYNLVRPHMALKNSTPAERAGMKYSSANKLLEVVNLQARSRGKRV